LSLTSIDMFICVMSSSSTASYMVVREKMSERDVKSYLFELHYIFVKALIPHLVVKVA
jgi:hypothetical protein